MELRRFTDIIVGNYEITEELLEAVKAAGIKASRCVESMLQKIEVEKTEREISLVIVTPEELGFKDAALMVDIIKKAKEFGLEKCVPEVAAQIMIQGGDIIFEGDVIVAADPIQDSDGDPGLFVLNCGEIDSVYGVNDGEMNYDMCSDDVLVFMQSVLQKVGV